MRLRRTLALVSLAALALTGCSAPEAGEAPSNSSSAPTADVPATAAPAMAKVAVSAAFGEPAALDRTMYGGTANGGCVLGPEETMVCTDRSGQGGEWLNAIIGRDQLRNPQSLEARPPVPLPGFDPNAGADRVDRLERVLATPQGYLMQVVNPALGGTTFKHITTGGKEIWVHTDATDVAVRDLAVTADEVLIGTDAGITSILLKEGTAGTTAAPAGTLLAGSVPGRDGYSTYSPGVVGLPVAAGGDVLGLADVPAAAADSCTGSTAPAESCVQVEQLYADSEFLVVSKRNRAAWVTEVYDAGGVLLWSTEVPVTSAIRLGDTFVLGHAGSNKVEGGEGRLAVVVAETGKELATTKVLDGGSYFVAGAMEDSVIFGVDGDSVPGAYDVSYGVMPVTVETKEVAVEASTATPASAEVTGSAATGHADRSAGWTTEKSAGGAFSFQVPGGWTVERTPGEIGDGTVVTDPASGIQVSMVEGMSGLGGVCGPGQGGLDESVTVVSEPVAGLHLASAPVGKRSPTLEVEHEGIYFTYSVNMTAGEPQCGMYSDLFEWPGVGTVKIDAKVSAVDLVKAGVAPAEYVGSDLHRDVSRVLASVTAVGE